MFAMLHRTRGGIAIEDLQGMRDALGPGDVRHWISDAGDIGVAWTAGSLLDANGRSSPVAGVPFALAAGRLDAPTALHAHGAACAGSADARQIAACVLQKGEAAPAGLFGDYALAHWTGRALFIATDHLGSTPIYHARTPQGFAVATRLPALLAFPDTPRELDGLGLGLVAMIQMGRGAGHTAWRGIRLLRGGHSLWLDAQGNAEERRWWNPDVEVRRTYRDPRDYTAEIGALFADAVRSRLPGKGPVGCTLSGGLDSTLVAGFAAPMLAEAQRDLHAVTSVPHPALHVTPQHGWENDDWPHAHQMTRMHPNLRHEAVSPEGICLLDVLQAVHASSATPSRNVANQLWLTEIGLRARAAGCEVVLAGFHGNSTVSFAGHGGVTRLLRRGRWQRALEHMRQERGFGARSMLRHALVAATGEPAVRKLSRLLGNHPPPFMPPGAQLMQPHVRGYYPVAPPDLMPVVDRADWRRFISQPRTAFCADMRAHAGVEFRDPTGDRRLCEHLLGCPADAFVGGGFGRLQARLLGEGRVPDAIRWRRTLGDQAPEQAGWFSLYPERYRDAWADVRRLPWTREFIDCAQVDDVLEDLVCGRPHPRLIAAAVHRILDIGTFIATARHRWRASDATSCLDD